MFEWQIDCFELHKYRICKWASERFHGELDKDSETIKQESHLRKSGSSSSGYIFLYSSSTWGYQDFCLLFIFLLKAFAFDVKSECAKLALLMMITWCDQIAGSGTSPSNLQSIVSPMFFVSHLKYLSSIHIIKGEVNPFWHAGPLIVWNKLFSVLEVILCVTCLVLEKIGLKVIIWTPN